MKMKVKKMAKRRKRRGNCPKRSHMRFRWGYLNSQEVNEQSRTCSRSIMNP